MKRILVTFCGLSAANALLAGPNEAALRQAREVSAKVTQAEQGNPPANAPAPAAPQPPAPQTNPVLQKTLRNIADLRADFAALGSLTGTNSAGMQRQLLQNDLATAAAATKPSPSSVSRLADDLVAASSGKLNAAANQQKLAQDVHAIFNSSYLSAAQQQMFVEDIGKILQSSGAAADAVTNVVTDIKQIVAETK